MSEYSELIKKFDKIRDYMRDFYVYGFKSREDFNSKSLRSYDNEKRRIESYLAEYMSFSKDENGKNVYIEADCSEISENPLYRAFKAKSFTKNDITLNFIILDILAEYSSLSVSEIAEKIASEYFNYFEDPAQLDVTTIRNKLLEYEKLGLLTSTKVGKKIVYAQNNNDINLENISDALLFFSEISPLGVIGSFLLDKLDVKNNIMCFKHHYIMHALESEVVYCIFQAIKHKQKVKISVFSSNRNTQTELVVTPLKILISVQSGRRYVSVCKDKKISIHNFRLDYINSVVPVEHDEHYDMLREKHEKMLPHTWGSSFGNGRLETLKMILYIPHNERFIINRVHREGRHGVLTQVNNDTYEYSIQVYDCMEMMPWVRTFIGRIIKLEGTNKRMIKLFYEDMNRMHVLYGGEENVVL